MGAYAVASYAVDLLASPLHDPRPVSTLDPLTVAFGAALRRERERLGLSQEALADRAGVDRTEIGKLERGTREPRLRTLVKIYRALDVSPDVLVGEPLNGIEL